MSGSKAGEAVGIAVEVGRSVAVGRAVVVDGGVVVSASDPFVEVLQDVRPIPNSRRANSRSAICPSTDLTSPVISRPPFCALFAAGRIIAVIYSPLNQTKTSLPAKRIPYSKRSLPFSNF
jgi:hypothetical protein